jgi:hypothetical protein
VQVGVDIGQRQDPSAVVVVEMQLRDYEVTARDPRTGKVANYTGGALHYVARSLGRLPLGTPYSEVVERLVAVCEQLKAKRTLAVYVDANVVGQPVVDLLKDAGIRGLYAVYLTGGEREHKEGREIRLPKMLLVSRMKVLLQTGRILLPRTPEAEALKTELQNFETRFTEAANLQFGAFKVGVHDDLAVALGLACLDSARKRPSWETRRV